MSHGRQFAATIFLLLLVLPFFSTLAHAQIVSSTNTTTENNVTVCVTSNINVSRTFLTFVDCANSTLLTATTVLQSSLATNNWVSLGLVVNRTSSNATLEYWEVEQLTTQRLLAYSVGSLGTGRTSLVFFIPYAVVTRTYHTNTTSGNTTLHKAVVALPIWSEASPVTQLPITDRGLGRRALVNSTTSPQNVTVTGYLFDCYSVFQVVDSRGVNLVSNPSAHSKEVTLQSYSRNGFCLVTYPTAPPVTPASALSTNPFFGTVYPVSSANVLTIAAFWNSVARNGELRVAALVSLPSATSSTITIWQLTDLGLNTPAPTPAPNLVPVKEVTVIAWWVWFVIALGVVAALGICFCLAKRSSLRKEDHKKTAKRRKAEQDRFDKMAREMGRGIDVDDDGENRH